MTPLNRFLDKVNKTDSCWLWTGAMQGTYGAMWFIDNVDRSHRISYQLFIGKIPDNMCVLHSCDNRICVNPNHLFLGTKKDNYEDMVKKGRKGNNVPNKNTHLIKHSLERYSKGCRCAICKKAKHDKYIELKNRKLNLTNNN